MQMVNDDDDDDGCDKVQVKIREKQEKWMACYGNEWQRSDVFLVIRLIIWMECISVPPVTVSVANLYSATEKPALLCAVTLSWYQLAGSKSKTTKFPPGFTLFDTWFHSIWFLQS